MLTAAIIREISKPPAFCVRLIKKKVRGATALTNLGRLSSRRWQLAAYYRPDYGDSTHL
jgi:hypothetical protein